MAKTEWVAVIGAISGALIAVLVSLYDLGPSAPFVVLSLLIVLPMFGIILIQERRITALTQDIQSHESAYAETSKGTALALQAMTNVLAELAKRDSLARVLSELSDEKQQQAMATAAATAATKVSDAALIAAKAVTDTAMAVAKEVKDASSTR